MEGFSFSALFIFVLKLILVRIFWAGILWCIRTISKKLKNNKVTKTNMEDSDYDGKG